MLDVLRDGDNVMIGVRWPTGHELTAVVYIDHNVGTLVRDAFVVPAGGDETLAHYRRLSRDEESTQFAPIDPADAYARISEAIATAEITMPPFESETWPSCRSAIEWVVRELPEGGKSYERPEWSEAQRRELARAFFASEYGVPLTALRENHELLDSMLWFGADHGPGDPLRWSPTAVEILLIDWFPRKIVAPADHLAGMPNVLRALIRYAHAVRKVPARLTRGDARRGGWLRTGVPSTHPFATPAGRARDRRRGVASVQWRRGRSLVGRDDARPPRGGGRRSRRARPTRSRAHGPTSRSTGPTSARTSCRG